MIDISEATLQRIYENIPRYVEEFLGSTDPKRILPLTERVKKWYFNDKPCTKYSLPFVIKFLSDVYFNIPAKELADRRRKRNAPTYFYVFSYVGSEMVFTKYVDLPTATIAGNGTIFCNCDFCNIDLAILISAVRHLLQVRPIVTTHRISFTKLNIKPMSRNHRPWAPGITK